MSIYCALVSTLIDLILLIFTIICSHFIVNCFEFLIYFYGYHCLLIPLSIPSNLIGINLYSELWMLSLSYSFMFIFLFCRLITCWRSLSLSLCTYFSLLSHFEVPSTCLPIDHPGALIQNHVSFWRFLALVPQWWWGWLGSASCCQVTWVFTCFSWHEAHISSSHRQQLTASISTALKSAWPHANLFFIRGQIPTILCLLMYAETHRPSDVLCSIECFHLLLGVGYLSFKCRNFKCSFKMFYLLFSYVWKQKVLKT